ncbi:hypothetical protein [Asanoa siamensis]|uniref:hypothetical protein n=1 Tax=Asanoa siamensis TaxID=926357 RepID=UPI0019444CAB|nr:hypothetical protein [Asanoa siamensis]
MTEPMFRHCYTRPTWTCVVDGDEWPCASAKSELRHQFGVRGRVFMDYFLNRLREARLDLPDEDDWLLVKRFVLWSPEDHR